MTDFVQHDPYFREWHKRNNTHASLTSPAAAAGGIIDASSAQASLDDDEDNNHASDNASIDKADAPPPQGVAPDAKKVYDQEPVPQAEREDVERAIKKDTDNKDQSDASDVKSGLAAGSAAAIAGAAGVAVAAASTDESPEPTPKPTPQHSDPHPPTAAQVDAPTILHAPKDTKVVTEVTKDESKMNTNEPVTTEAPAPTGTAEDTVVPETKEEPVTAAQPQPTNTTESTIVPEPVEKDEQKQKQEQPKEKLNAFEETPITTPKEESPAPIAAPAPSVPVGCCALYINISNNPPSLKLIIQLFQRVSSISRQTDLANQKESQHRQENMCQSTLVIHQIHQILVESQTQLL